MTAVPLNARPPASRPEQTHDGILGRTPSQARRCSSSLGVPPCPTARGVSAACLGLPSGTRQPRRSVTGRLATLATSSAATGGQGWEVEGVVRVAGRAADDGTATNYRLFKVSLIFFIISKFLFF